MSSGKAAASEGARRTVSVRRASERCENAARSLFQYPNERGRPVSTGILRSTVHVELSGSRKSSGKM